MKMLFLLPIVVVALALTGCGSETVSTATDEAAIRAQNKKWHEAVAVKDAKAIAQLYADDAAMFIPNVPKVAGREAIEGGWADFFKTGMSTSFETEKLIVSKGGDLAVEIGSYKNFTGEGAATQTTERGKFVNTWIKHDGTWFLQTDSFSSDAPPTPSAPEAAPASTP
jgi:uncharacterized protein (TIGR02246 family)